MSVIIPKNTVLFDPVSPTLTYVGWSPSGNTTDELRWEICQIIFDGSGNVLSQKWAGASGNYDKAWDSRAGYTYS